MLSRLNSGLFGPEWHLAKSKVYKFSRWRSLTGTGYTGPAFLVSSANRAILPVPWRDPSMAGKNRRNGVPAPRGVGGPLPPLAVAPEAVPALAVRAVPGFPPVPRGPSADDRPAGP